MQNMVLVVIFNINLLFLKIQSACLWTLNSYNSILEFQVHMGLTDGKRQNTTH